MNNTCIRIYWVCYANQEIIRIQLKHLMSHLPSDIFLRSVVSVTRWICAFYVCFAVIWSRVVDDAGVKCHVYDSLGVLATNRRGRAVSQKLLHVNSFSLLSSLSHKHTVGPSEIIQRTKVENHSEFTDKLGKSNDGSNEWCERREKRIRKIYLHTVVTMQPRTNIPPSLYTSMLLRMSFFFQNWVPLTMFQIWKKVSNG